LFRSPTFFCSTSQPPASIPVSRREFWDVLAHLSSEGLTILVATPYLDEAERCHRIGFMHQGQILQIGTSTELCSSLDAKRIELRTPDLRKTERLLSAQSGPGKEILDVQRFGDRLDLLVHDPEKEQKRVAEELSRAGLTIDEMHVDQPTLENTFVARLRALGQSADTAEFPARHDHSDLRGQIAIGATNLIKEFGEFTAVKNVSLQIRNGEVYGLLGPTARARRPSSECSAACSTQPAASCSWPARSRTCAPRRCASASGTCRRSSPCTTI